jgi:capsular polysaccharide biosynthesis protein
VKLHARSIEDLERQVNVVPRVEADYQKLSRDYAGMNAQYQEIVRSLETARVSGEAAHEEAVDFRIIEPATAGNAPVSPKRLLLIPAIFAAALGMAVWVALLRSRIAPVIYASEDLAKISPLPLLGIIGNTSPESLLIRKRRSIIGFTGSLACLLLGLGVVLWAELFLKASIYSSMGGK